MEKKKSKAPEPRYHHGDLRRAITDAAIELIEESGIQNLSLREVSRKIGVTTAAPYHHFKDREALLIEIGIQGYRRLLQTLEAARDAAKEPPDEMTAEARAYMNFARDHTAFYSVMFSEEVALKYDYPELKSTADRCFLILVETIAKTSKLTPQKSAEAGLCVWSMLHGMTVLDRSNMLLEEWSEQQRIAVAGVLGILKGFSKPV